MREERLSLCEKTIASLRERLERIEAAEESLIEIATETDLKNIIDLVAETAAGLINAETVTVPLLSPDNLEVHYNSAYGKHKDVFMGLSLPLENAGLCGWVLENRKPILTNNLQEDPRVPTEQAKALGINAAALVPLIARGRIIGGLSAFNKTDGTKFTEEDLMALSSLANYAAVTIDNVRLMEAVMDEKMKLEAILNGVRDGIVFLSRDGTIINVNKAVEQYFPMKAGDMLGAKIHEFVSFPSLSEVFDWKARAHPGKRCWEVLGCREKDCPVFGSDILRCWAYSTGHCYKREYRQNEEEKAAELCAHCDVLKQASLQLGAIREVHIMGKTLQASSTIVIDGLMKDVFGEVMVFHDVTDKKRAEQERSDFISMMTHDLKAPVTSISGYSELMGEESDLEKLREMNRAIMRNSTQLMKMINDFLDISKIEFGKIILTPLGISLKAFLPTALQQFAAQAMEKKINLSWQVDDGTPDVVADIDQLSRIIGNLVSNSLKYTPSGGNIKVTASKGPEKYVRIAVKDDGDGINAEDLPRVFDKYYTGSKDKLKGAGLGLTIVKALTEAHGGMVSVKSEKGKGAEFTVLLPAAKKEKPKGA